MVQITSDIAVDERELVERFVRASGPGGQNVNKVATAVELRFDIRASPSLAPPVKTRLIRLGGARVTNEGVLVIRSDRFRTQERNREDARERLIALVRQALVPPKTRVSTRPPRSSRIERLESKVKRSTVKRLRRTRSDDD